ncbi:DUF5719 family protein [Microbacterium sp. ZXX196]|uniref:DUF5719 family protein n=1 Tax=Microbacterium sp. ZXX196 TaxID=2609291 RepID=UPI0012B6DA8D|nr:hypothetical protein [Microbacterium sp. ZXX196]
MSPARLSGVAAGLVLAVAVAAVAVAPWPTLTGRGGGEAAAPRVEVAPVPAEIVMSCDGDIVALGRDAADAAGVSSAAGTTLTAENARGEEPAVADALEFEGVGDAPVVSQRPDGDEAVSVAGAVSASLDEEDLGGYAMSACRTGASEAWLVGGATATGTTGIITLANSSDVTATVTLEVFGVDGGSVPPGGELALPAHTTRAVPVASIAGGEQAPVIRVTSEGAPVRSALQTSIIDTLEPRGIDIQAPTTPATSAVIPGVVVTEQAAETPGAEPLLRLLGTSGEAQEVTVAVIDEETGETASSTAVPIENAAPIDVALDELEPGRYTVRVDGAAAVVAAVKETGTRDFAWLAAPEVVEGETLVAVPETENGRARLSVAAAADGPARVRVVRLGADEEEVLDVAAGASESLVLDADATYRVVVEDGAVFGMVSSATDEAMGAFPLAPDVATPEPITVVP